MKTVMEIRHFHLFCGLGGGARGFNRANPRVGNLRGVYRCLGGIDVGAAEIRDFERLTGTPGTVLDLFDRSQYQAFHGQEPPPGWREATVADIHAAAGNERPHIVFLSAPCKGFSGLLGEMLSQSDKYQALNGLTLRGVWLMLEAWADDPPELVIFENVPRIASRGRALLEQINSLLRSYGYAVAETAHDCGEIGGLAQSRKRFLLVARHQAKVPAFLYEPPKKQLRPISDIISRMRLPGDPEAGPMHRVPALQWKTWVRLAFVEAGKDWRSLNRLTVDNGKLRDYLVVPEYRSGYMGVNEWSDSMGTVTGRSSPTNGAFSVADPRYQGQAYSQYGVMALNETSGVVTGQRSPGQGRFSVADPRPANNANSLRGGKYRVTRIDQATGTVIAGSTTGEGAFAVADPRSGLSRQRGDNYLTGGHYGVLPWSSTAGAVSAAASHDNGKWTVADPRCCGFFDPTKTLPEPNERLVAIIQSIDNTWHRPLTTLELAALQSLFDPEEEHFDLDGASDSAKRERIGNAVPPKAAEAIAEVMGETLLLAWSGETFVLSSTPLWVRPVAIALSVDQPAEYLN